MPDLVARHFWPKVYPVWPLATYFHRAEFRHFFTCLPRPRRVCDEKNALAGMRAKNNLNVHRCIGGIKEYMRRWIMIMKMDFARVEKRQDEFGGEEAPTKRHYCRQGQAQNVIFRLDTIGINFNYALWKRAEMARLLAKPVQPSETHTYSLSLTHPIPNNY